MLCCDTIGNWFIAIYNVVFSQADDLISHRHAIILILIPLPVCSFERKEMNYFTRITSTVKNPGQFCFVVHDFPFIVILKIILCPPKNRDMFDKL